MPPHLPIAISVPHGGTEVPPEAREHCILDLPSILTDGDTWASQLYDLGDRVLTRVHTPIARAVVDMNRAPDDLPPGNPDGVVKTVTVSRRQVWRDPGGPPSELAETLIATYHAAFHRAIRAVAGTPGVSLLLDCHTMLASAPPQSPSPGTPRPPLCISNRGGPDGQSTGDEPITAPADLVLALRDALERRFCDLTPQHALPGPCVRVNEPFRGGHVTRHHGTTSTIPFIQLEISRALYMQGESPVTAIPPDHVQLRMDDLRNGLLDALEDIRGLL